MQPYVILVQQLANGQAKNMLFGVDTLESAMLLVNSLESMTVNYDTFVAIQDTNNIRNVYQHTIYARKN